MKTGGYSFNIRSALIALLLPMIGGIASAQRQNQSFTDDSQPTRVRQVFVNVTGDPKLAHRLLAFIDLELEDAGLQLANTEANADAEIDADVASESGSQNLGIGILRARLTADGKSEAHDSCESLSSSEDGDFFGLAAQPLADWVREKFPKADTIRVDPASDTTASNLFGAELPGFLKASGLKVVDSGTADATLLVRLAKEKVSVEETILKYKLSLTLKNGSVPLRSNETSITSATAKSAPELCPSRVDDLDWLVGQDPFFQIARSLVKTLRNNNRRAALGQGIKK
jgi:hypothetical protein